MSDDIEDEGGTYRAYVPKKFNANDLAHIDQANAIIAEYAGFALTLRQLYYQFVARDLFSNNIKNYNYLGRIISEGRLAGVVSWTAIEDRGRNLMGLRTHKNPAEAIKALRAEYKTDLWKNQIIRPEVWVEKQALEGVIGTICDELRVNFFATKGYNSQSEQWRAGRRFAGYIQKGQRPIVFHFGDHDPSGLDMTRDNRERLAMFAGMEIQVIRLALNMDQIEHWSPPPNPAKVNDPRADAYIARYGDESWELDALDPAQIQGLIKEAILPFRDPALWSEALAEEARGKDELDIVIKDM